MLRLGGKFGGVSFVKPWHDYFPHFGAADLRANLHQQLDALQGQRRMLMVGEVFNLPLVSAYERRGAGPRHEPGCV